MLRPGKKSSKMNMAGITGSTELRPAPLIQTQVRSQELGLQSRSEKLIAHFQLI